MYVASASNKKELLVSIIRSILVVIQYFIDTVVKFDSHSLNAFWKKTVKRFYEGILIIAGWAVELHPGPMVGTRKKLVPVCDFMNYALKC